jgi:hypothetical protein
MITNDFIKYIFGDWAKFILFFIGCLTSLVGITFLGGSFIHAADSQELKDLAENTPDVSSNLEGMALYIKYYKTCWLLLKQYIAIIMFTFFNFSNNISSLITLFILPFGVIFMIPFLYPLMIGLTGIAVGTTPFSENMAPLTFPPANRAFFCEPCVNKDTLWYWSIWHHMGFIFSSCMRFALNCMVWSCIAGAGVVYLMWNVFVAPIFKYPKIVETVLSYSTILLILSSVLYFISCTIFLGFPLRMTSIGIFAFTILWIFFEYLKKLYINSKEKV